MNVPAHTVRWTPRTDAPHATPSRHPPLDGCAAVNVGELSAGRWTAQSSIDEGAELCFSQPTRREPSPWWTIDLGEPSVIEHLELSLGALPSGCEVRIDGYTYPSPSGAPPVGCHHQRWDLTALAAEADGSLRARAEVDWVARFVRVQLVCASEVTLHVRGLSLRGAVVFANTLRGTYERAFTLFADRPLVLARGPDARGPFAPVARYRDVWEQGRALSLALAARLEVPSHDRPIFVGLCLKNGPAWLLGELACVLRGYVSVSLSPEDPPTRVEEILARCPLDAVLCEPESAPAFESATRARGTIVISVGSDSSFVEEIRDDPRELARERRLTLRPLLTERHPERPARAQDEEAPCAILFTSGSTGSPKGAARSFRKMLAILKTYGVGQVGHHLSFQPLSHLSERHYLPATILHGARVGFCADSGSLLTDLRDFEPSWVSSVPRLYEVVRGRFERAISTARAAAPTRDPSEVEREVLRSFRGVFGGRLQGVAVGSAPVSDELRAFLRALFPDLWVVEGYGSTEVGTITGNQVSVSDVDLRITPVEGYPSTDEFTRGELWVRSAHVIDGYFNDPDATRAHLDAEGYFRTGDLVERDRAGRVRVIGRSSAAVKLASGEFVALDRVEAALAACPLIDRVMVAPTGDRRGVVAVVRVEPRALAEVLSPSDSSIEERIDDPAVVAHVLYALAEVSARAGLPPRERIVAVTIAQDGWSVADGSLTSSGKLARPGAMARFRDALASVDRATTEAALRENDALARQLAEIAAKVTGRPTRAHDLLHGTVAADSLEVAELLAAFGERLRVNVPVALWSASATLAALADRLRGGVAARENDGPSLARLDLSLPLGLRPCVSSPRPRDEDILLTGATGLLGAHLLEELSVRTNARVRCLVRAMDAPSARARVREALARFHVGALDEARWDVVVGDLCRPDLGLSERDRCALSAQVTSVIHAGASVNWLDGYAALRTSNVEGTRALLAFASEREGRALHHVSTISVTTPDGDESSIEPVERALHGSGYGLSKWVSETLVRRAASEGVPVTIHRPGLIVGHSARGVGNPDDFVHRYLSACARLGVHLDEDALLDMTPADYVARAIVTVAMDPSLRGTVTHLCNVDRSMTFRALGAAMRGLGVPCEPLPYERFRARAVLVRESPLWPLAGYFGASGFRLGSGPWPCARTRALLEPRGARSPVITPEFIAKILTSLGIVTSRNP